MVKQTVISFLTLSFLILPLNAFAQRFSADPSKCIPEELGTEGHMIIVPGTQKRLSPKDFIQLENSHKYDLLDVSLAQDDSYSGYQSVKSYAQKHHFSDPVVLNVPQVITSKTLAGEYFRQYLNGRNIAHDDDIPLLNKSGKAFVTVDKSGTLEEKLLIQMTVPMMVNKSKILYTAVMSIKYQSQALNCITPEMLDETDEPIAEATRDYRPNEYIFSSPITGANKFSDFFGPRLFNSMKPAWDLEAKTPGFLAKPENLITIPFFRKATDPANSIKNGQWKIHQGVDIAVPIGTFVRSVAAGTVVIAGNILCPGNTVVVEHSFPLKANPSKTDHAYSMYLHLSGYRAVVQDANGKFLRLADKNESLKPGESKRILQTGDPVKRGQVVGLSGDTGSCAQGPHLHLAMRVPKDKPVNIVGTKSAQRFQSLAAQTGVANASDFIEDFDLACKKRKVLEINNANKISGKFQKTKLGPLTAGTCGKRFEAELSQVLRPDITPIFYRTQSLAEILSYFKK